MYLKTLYLRNFRLYPEACFSFREGVNLIQGMNATGKTSILEAIHVLMTGRSFRTSNFSDLLRHGTEELFLQADFVKYGIEQKVKIYFNSNEKNISHNGTVFNSPSNLLGIIQGVTLHPDDAMVVKGTPQARRQMLDLFIGQADPLYIHHRTRYEKAMRQRNVLLRKKSLKTIESWEFEMAHSAAYIVQERSRTLSSLQEISHSLHNRISGEHENLQLLYKNEVCHLQKEDIQKFYVEKFEKSREKEMLFGITLSGPHKDDFSIVVGGKEARFFGSEGQQRSCMASLRLAEWERLKLLSEQHPLMLIDDVGISFDSKRCTRLLEQVSNMNQVFLTSTQPLPLEKPHHLVQPAVQPQLAPLNHA